MALHPPKHMPPFLLMPRPWWLNHRWPDGRRINTLEDRFAAVLVGIGILAASIIVWFNGRTGSGPGPAELGQRSLLLMNLLTAVIVWFVVSTRMKRSSRFAADASTPRLWTPLRGDDGRIISDNDDRVWQIAQLALVLLITVWVWSAGRLGFPTQTGEDHYYSGYLAAVAYTGLAATFTGVMRLRWIAAHSTAHHSDGSR